MGVDPLQLSSAGWGVVYARDTRPEVRAALAPLLAWRRRQAGKYCKEYVVQPGQTKDEFLASYQAAHGPADPRKVPYYLLLVGSPAEIPFQFQYELDVQYAVGRLHFDSPEEYANYARRVVAVEGASPGERPQGLTLFGVTNPDDLATRRTTRRLIEPLAGALDTAADSWRPRVLVGDQATKARLASLLAGGPETPALLFTASHGMVFPGDRGRILREQGAILCQDWPGPEMWRGEIPREHYLAADDIGPDADLRGLISFHFACYSAGTPHESEFDHPLFAAPKPLLDAPILSALAKRMLGHPRGALAFLGHVDRAWTTSFDWIDAGPAAAGEAPPAQIETFQSMLERLLEGHPVGSAMEFVNSLHADLSVTLTHLFSDLAHARGPSRSVFSRVWRANNDARGFVVLGDPAVRLPGPHRPARSDVLDGHQDNGDGDGKPAAEGAG